MGHRGLLRARSGVLGMSRGSTADMPRRLETWVLLCNLMLKLRGISRSSAILGSDSPESSNRKGNFIHSSPAVWACLMVDPLDTPRTPYRESKGKRKIRMWVPSTHPTTWGNPVK